MEEKERAEYLEKIDTLIEKNEKLEAALTRHEHVRTVIAESSEGLTLFNTVPVGISIANAKGEAIKANDTVLKLLGYTPEEKETVNLFDIYVNAEERSALIEELKATGSVRNFETALRRKDGQVIRALISSDYITLNDEKVLLTSVQDITRFKREQEHLRETELQYHMLFSNAPVGITVTDFAGKILASNNAIQDLLGYTSEEIAIKSFSDFYCDEGERQQLLDETRENHVVRDFETSFRGKDGKPVAVLINTDLIDFGEQQGVLLTSIRDISNLKHIEKELIKERDFTNLILNTAALLVIVLDGEGKIKKVNRATERISGYAFNELKGKRLWEVLSTEPEITEEQIQQFLTGSLTTANERVWISKSGVKRLISWTSNALVNQEAVAEYIVVTGVDITERRQAENELQDANVKLTAWVSELEEKTNDISLLGEMGGYLQGCQNVGEACAISAQYIQKMCPLSGGAIYLISPSKDLAEAYEIWGDENTTQKLFFPLNCWAVRRGRINLVDDEHPGLLCSHITGPKGKRYICLPMAANGEIIGVLHLSRTTLPYSDHKIRTISAAAETIALALSNIMLQQTLRQQSIRDVLTGLFNRRYMEESLTRELHRAEREHVSVGVLMFDIDHFKDFNDIYGHDGGDAMLHELGDFLIKNTRGEDIACRYGGEEFVAVFPNTSPENARKRAEDLRLGIKALNVSHLGKPLRKCTISIGVASFPEHGLTPDEVIKAADDALYQSKNEGRDRVVSK